jgi:hypothetical protein
MKRAKERNYDCCKANLCDAILVITPELLGVIQSTVFIDVE